ncbi:MAG: isopeptide-forming domain-containing fimbrial protein, partial [Propionibacteriaceae bacterium]|nr:isopeptide-forming domain-containing fimbrial protein [Propionibacteriaceae bacterium]
MWVTALALIAAIAGALPSTVAEAAPVADGITVNITPASVNPGSGEAFTLLVTDTNLSGSSYDVYYLGGLPNTSWTVRNGTTTLSPQSVDPVIYALPRADVLAGKITIIPPYTYNGTLTGVTLSRVMKSPNLITDFDNGTFDYLGQSHPTLPAGSTQYGYHNPQQTYTGNGRCDTPQYGPCDGDYTIWPTANMNGPARHYQNYWADLRSITNPMVTPDSVNVICGSQWASKYSDYTAYTTSQVTAAQSSASGKIAVFNGSQTMPVPNDLLVTTVNGLDPNANYMFSFYVANVSDDRWDSTLAPVRTAAYVKTSQSDVGKLIGSTAPQPIQASCYNHDTKWNHISSLVTTTTNGQLILGIRNHGSGGFGNDIAVDSLELYKLALVSFDLPVIPSIRGLDVKKTSDPVSGTPVPAGKTITYTITARNTGNVNLNPVTLTDDLSGVLSHASIVAGSIQATIDGVATTTPTLTGSTLQWVGPLNGGKTVIVTYKVLVNQNVKAGDVLRNKVTGKGTDPLRPSDPTVDSGCVTGNEPGCYSDLPASLPGFTASKTSNPVSGSTVAAGDLVTYTLTGENTGNVALNPVKLTDDLSKVLVNGSLVAGSITATVDGVAAGTASLQGSNLIWTGPLAAGKKVIVTYQVRLNTTLDLNQLLVNSVKSEATEPNNPGFPVETNCVTGNEFGCSTTLTPGRAGLNVNKSSVPASGAMVARGGTITYTITATNSGNVTLNPVVLRDYLSQVMAYATLDETSLSAKIDGVDAGAISVVGPWLVWDGSLAPGKTVVVTYKVTVGQNIQLGDRIINQVQGTATNPARPSDTVPSNCVTGLEPGCSSTIGAEIPGYSVTKVSDPASGGLVRPGELITYTVTLRNTGNVTLASETVTDDLSKVLPYATF